MSLPVTLQPDAQDEYDEAVGWFEARQAGAGRRFAFAVRDTLARIGASPRMHAVVQGDVRKAIVSGYPYYCVY